MSTTIKAVIENFEFFYSSLLNRAFAKSANFKHWEERKMLLLIRAYLLGCYGESFKSEFQTDNPGSGTGKGRFDFLIDDVAVEFAVRTPNASPSKLSLKTMKSEIDKLQKREGKSVLILFDFSRNPHSSDEMESYRETSQDEFDHIKYPFTLAYFYLEKLKPITYNLIKKHIKAS